MKTEKQNVLDLPSQQHPAHSYLFGSEYESVDDLGKVIILSVPVLPLKEPSQTKFTSSSSKLLLNCLKQTSCHMTKPDKDNEEPTVQDKLSLEPILSWDQHETDLDLAKSYSDVNQDKTLSQVEIIPETPVSKKTLLNRGDSVIEVSDVLEIRIPCLQADDYSNNIELSPRLTNMIQSGIVPESPINDTGQLKSKAMNEFFAAEVCSPMKSCENLLPKSPNKWKNGKSISSAYQRNNEMQTSLFKNDVGRTDEYNTGSPAADETNTSCSKDWLLSSGDKSENVKQVHKFRRLRKIGDIEKKWNPETKNEKSSASVANCNGSFSDVSPHQTKWHKGKRKQTGKMMPFIEEEADVSSDAEISGDEEDDKVSSSYDDSFIDDRTNPPSASTQVENSGVDMLAVYRRSLLTQSPMESTRTPESDASIARSNESKSSSVKTSNSFRTPQTGSENKFAGKDSNSFQMNTDRMSAAMPTVSTNYLTENETKLETRKRKLSFCQSGSIPAINLEPEFSLQSNAARKDTSSRDPVQNFDANVEISHDDQFFDDIDFDAVEAQATLLLKRKTELSVQKHDAISESSVQNADFQNSPSFDLGIW